MWMVNILLEEVRKAPTLLRKVHPVEVVTSKSPGSRNIKSPESPGMSKERNEEDSKKREE
jgi:hypothetical protein